MSDDSRTVDDSVSGADSVSVADSITCDDLIVTPRHQEDGKTSGRN